MARVLATSLLLVLVVPRPSAADTAALSGMPTYYWWGGCSPTSGGMIIGYWNHADLYPFYDGDASTWSGASYNSNGSAPTGTAAMVASWDHVHEGEGLGYDTGDGCGHYNPDLRDANCIADFMYTDDGDTSIGGLRTGLVDFAAWDNPDTGDLCESVAATSESSWYRWGADDVWAEYMAEIDTGRPPLVNMSRLGGSRGHSVAAYGYIDNSGTDDDYFAVRDTWSYGLSGAHTDAYIDGEGVEWWPWIPYDGSSTQTYDWRVDFMVTFSPEAVPEPATTVLLLTGVGAIALKLRRSSRRS